MNNKLRPETTLFLLLSVDGKISTGDTDKMDTDSDYPRIKGVKEGLQQYYDIEKTTDLFFLISGRVFAKIGFNEKNDSPEQLPATSVVIDDNHLTEKGVLHIIKKFKALYLVTNNPKHPAFNLKEKYNNIKIILYKKEIDFADMMQKLKQEYSVGRLTVQTGGTLNTIFVREGLIDHLSIVVAPVLVGGKETSTLMDNESLHSQSELFKLKALKLKDCKKLKNSYVHLLYDVINETVIS